jgi:hypothetical protein
MYISAAVLKKVHPPNIIRLAHYVGMATMGCLLEDIIQELLIKINY